ncbi:HAD-IIIA family hydrolase [Helicobacter saguini]|uniref:D,D-heptose 1,7-bisphosphate phosphatase n=1 Tax=Helicobacter saguini TaxID=1548018 RepID=A0A347VPP2_9HELI|nr:HAD family hydrolase [Helicobacter saguini]MWV68059.1 HAD-IIIA family hydrolase [Helicobacter saguini]MWV70478.1 HAD-IIIA family hydrolase [Helicobacter saguini]MWV72379.1 HAD-IIIA family hydrolase [Helicobacter saguini]TLD92342.1 HAD family hydrolase [Helicobacter saguini]
MQKAIFFDRDGVINKDFGYVHKVQDFIFFEDFFACAAAFKTKNYKLIVVTNQSGIERGYYDVEDFLKLSKFMQDSIFKKLKFRLDRIYFCPFLNDEKKRKPAPGMIFQAQSDFNLNLSECLLVGDNISDIKAGQNAGVGELFLINRDFKNIDSNNLNAKVINNLNEIIK